MSEIPFSFVDSGSIRDSGTLNTSPGGFAEGWL